VVTERTCHVCCEPSDVDPCPRCADLMEKVEPLVQHYRRFWESISGETLDDGGEGEA
jgi:hypothetical protein